MLTSVLAREAALFRFASVHALSHTRVVATFRCTQPCKTNDGEVYYFNFSSGESVWDHPCDEY